MNKRLANVKTRRETGLDYVISSMNLNTPFGAKAIKEKKPFFPGQEEQLKRELDKVEDMMLLAKKSARVIDILMETFMGIKDNTFTIERSQTGTLSVVEIFEIKTLLLQMKKIKELLKDEKIPSEFVLEDTQVLLDVLDPRGDRLNTFYIYDEFSGVLKKLRKEKREIEVAIRKENKIKKEEIKQKYGVSLTPKFEYTVSKTSDESIKMIQEIADLEQSDEDYMSVTFSLKKSEKVYSLTREMEALNVMLDEEELKVRNDLSKTISKHGPVLLGNCKKIGELDITLSKALYAQKHHCSKPTVVDEHVVAFEDGRNLHVEDVLLKKDKPYCPVSVELADGVTCITGANMGGKTVSLKLIGMVAILTQYAFFVPCKSATVGLSNYMQILIGDSQSVERGLSSFGSEMEELKEILDHSRDRSLLLIDEIASGTNPIEGLALTKSLVDHLKEKNFITLITTHYEAVTAEGGIRNMQVVGLANADFDKLDKEIKYANRKERINVISKYMDYRLKEVETESEIPKDALNIAKMLGIGNEIIEGAKKYIKGEKG